MAKKVGRLSLAEGVHDAEPADREGSALARGVNVLAKMLAGVILG